MSARGENVKKAMAIKAVEDEDGAFEFEGYLSTYGNEDRDGDIIEPGAFDESIAKKATVPLCFNHEWGQVLGKLDLTSDEKGLKIKGTMDGEDGFAAGIYRKMKMGALDSMSIGMWVEDFEPIDAKDLFGGWQIKKASVLEGSIVTVPANEEAAVTSVKDFGDAERKELQTLRFEKRMQKIKEAINKGKSLLKERKKV